MAISLDELQRVGTPVSLVVHSIEGSIYQLSALLDGSEVRVVGEDGRAVRRRSLSHMREALRGIRIETLSLRQASAYDEMIGQPAREEKNTLEVPLAATVEADVGMA